MNKEQDIDDYLEKVIPEWKDDERMKYFMQDFKSNRDINPQDWDNKLKFWTKVIREACLYTNKLTIDVNTIKNFVTRRKRTATSKTETPLGLSTIITELKHRNEFVEIFEFKRVFDASIQRSIGDWLLQTMIVLPTSWLWKTMTSTDDTTKPKLNENEKYVVMSILQNQVEKFMSEMYKKKISSFDLLLAPYQIEEFYKNYSAEEIYLLVNYIHANGHAAMIKILKDKVWNYFLSHTLQIGLKISQNRNNSMRPEVTTSDHNIVVIKETIHILEQQINRIHEEIDRCLEEVKNWIRKKERNTAKFFLQRKRLLENVLSKREASLLNINTIYQQIQDAQSDLEIVDVLAKGAQTLQSMTDKLKDMNVENTLDEVAAILSDSKEISEVIETRTTEMNEEFYGTDDELLQTLEELSMEIEAETKIKQGEIVLPETPPKEPVTREIPKTENDKFVEIAITPQKPKEIEKKATNEEKFIPRIEDINVSRAILLYELEEVEKEIEKYESPPQNLLQLKEDIQLSLKLMKVKLKRPNQKKEYLQKLETFCSECEQRAIQLQQENKIKESLRIMKHVSILEDEIEEIKNELSSSTKEKEPIAI